MCFIGSKSSVPKDDVTDRLISGSHADFMVANGERTSAAAMAKRPVYLLSNALRE